MSDMKTALHEAIEEAREGEVVTLVTIGDNGSGSLSNASAVGIQATIDVLITRLGYALAEEAGGQQPKSDPEAYCLGATSVAHSAKQKAEELKARRKGKHVTEDVTEGTAANDGGSTKETH